MNRGPRAALAMIATAAVAAAVPAAVGLSQQQAAAEPKQHVVKLLALSFSKRSIVANKGDTVRFVWVNGVHNVVSSSGPAKVDSGEPTARDKLKITLKKGRYRLHCEPHKSVGMVMTIRVK